MIVDFDDFHQENDRLDLLHELKEANPLFRCTLFAIPTLGEAGFWASVPEWCELAVHGWEHGEPALDGGECRTWSRERMLELIAAIEQQRDAGIRWVRGFKAPGWQISDGCYEALLESGWWVADQRYNDGRRPEGLRVHRLGDGDHWHGHVQEFSRRGGDAAFGELVERVGDATSFELISEVVKPWRRQARPAMGLSVIVPTVGRESLRRTLASVHPQLGVEDEVIVIADASADVSRAHEIYLEFGRDDPRFVFLDSPHEEPGFGYGQRNRGMEIASGSHLAFLDDDDVYCEGALAAMRAAACDRPVIFRMEYASGRSYGRAGDRLWREPELSYENVGTPMFLVPNDPEKLGRWAAWPESWNSACGGDFSFITGCVERMGPPLWREEVVASVRPAVSRRAVAVWGRRLDGRWHRAAAWARYYPSALWRWQVARRVRRWRGRNAESN